MTSKHMVLTLQGLHCCLLKPGVKRKRKTRASPAPHTELFLGEYKEQGTEEHLKQCDRPHSSVSLLLTLQLIDAHLGIESHFWSPESEFHTTPQKAKNFHFWTDRSLCNYEEVAVQSDISNVYTTERQKITWL